MTTRVFALSWAVVWPISHNKRGFMDAVSLAEYRRMPVLSVPYLIHRLIPEKGRIQLVGPAKAGKSFLALQIALAVAHGQPFIGRETKQGRVLYLQFDTPDHLWKERLDDLEVNGIALPEHTDIHLIKPGSIKRVFDIVSRDNEIQMIQLVERVRPKLVIIDVLAKLHHLDGNTERDMKRIFDPLNQIFADVALILLHHTTKSAERPSEDGESTGYVPRPSTAGRGSSYVAGEVDANWLLWPTTGGQALFWVESRFDEDIKLQALRNPDNGLWDFPEEASIKSESEKLVALCDEFPDKSHADLVPIVKQRFGLARTAYYRRMSGLRCSHKQGVE